MSILFSNFKERAVQWTVATIKFADNKADDPQCGKSRQRHSQTLRSELPGGFEAPGKLSSGQFSVKNGRQPRAVAPIEHADHWFESNCHHFPPKSGGIFCVIWFVCISCIPAYDLLPVHFIRLPLWKQPFHFSYIIDRNMAEGCTVKSSVIYYHNYEL